jgi:excisionase family DNA binding protein
MEQTKRRMSVRAVAMTYGIPARTVVRATETGELPALRTVTETGRERIYISDADVERWLDSMLSSTTLTAQVQ